MDEKGTLALYQGKVELVRHKHFLWLLMKKNNVIREPKMQWEQF